MYIKVVMPVLVGVSVSLKRLGAERPASQNAKPWRIGRCGIAEDRDGALNQSAPQDLVSGSCNNTKPDPSASRMIVGVKPIQAANFRPDANC